MIGAALVAALRAATWAFWVATLRSWNAAALTFLFSSRRSTTSRYDQPNSCEMRCRQYNMRVSLVLAVRNEWVGNEP